MGSNSLRIALDLEGVLVDTHLAFLKEVNNFISREHPEFDRKFDKYDIKGWEFKGIRTDFANLRGWNSEISEKFMFGDGNGWNGFMPITEEIWRERPEDIPEVSANVAESVKTMSEYVRDHGGALCLVTARERVDKSVERKVDQLDIREALDDVIIETDKHELDFNVYIDDFPKLYSRVGKGERHIMIDQPWNSEVELDKPHRRASDIEDAAKVIQDLG